MIRRPAVTLIEVLIAMFIMAIGMLALLVLFPLGAVSMGQALKDDRCASTAAMAENIAITMPTSAGIPGIRNDSNVTGSFVAPAFLVYVDPYGVIQNVGPLSSAPGVSIPRVSPVFVGGSTQLADRWFSLPDDIGFAANGGADTITTGGIVDRGRRYSYAYLLRNLGPSLAPNAPATSLPLNQIQMYVVVYSGRGVNTLSTQSGEWPYSATGTAGTNSLTISAVGTKLKRGGWILDTTPPATATAPVPTGYFYRVANFAESNGATSVDLESNLMENVTQIVFMENVAEVFDKGTSWQP